MRWVCGCVIGFPCSGYPTLGYRNGYEEKITAIAGFISVNRETGEFTGHLRDGTTWESKDQPTNTTGEN
jgi:hypothetical protein